MGGRQVGYKAFLGDDKNVLKLGYEDGHKTL